MDVYSKIHQMIKDKVIVSAYALGFGGIAGAVSKMAFGDKFGAVMNSDISATDLFKETYGHIIAEVAEEDLPKLTAEHFVAANNHRST